MIYVNLGKYFLFNIIHKTIHVTLTSAVSHNSNSNYTLGETGPTLPQITDNATMVFTTKTYTIRTVYMYIYQQVLYLTIKKRYQQTILELY